MSTLSDLGWWFDHLPSVIDDVSTAVTISRKHDLQKAWRDLMVMHGPLGVRQASETCDELDRELDTGDLSNKASSSDLLNLSRTIVRESQYNAHCIKGVRTLLKGLKKWRYTDGGYTKVPDTREKLAQDGFVGRQATQGSLIHLDPRVCEMTKSILLAALPEDRWTLALNRVSGRTGPGAVYEKLSASDRWGLIHGKIRSRQFPRGVIPPLITSDLWGTSSQLEDQCILSLFTCRLQAVPKDLWRFRLITVEQAEATWMQHWGRNALLECMSECNATKHLLSGFSGVLENLAECRFDDAQRVQQELAIIGSKGSWCDTNDTALTRPVTLDFTDASDWIAWSQTSGLFPVHVAEFLQSCRSSTAEYVDSDGVTQSTPINCFGGMGNALTFVVETLMFWAVTEAYRRLVGIPGKIWVYGDDVIMSNRLFQAGGSMILSLYEALNWRVNADKSFTTVNGRFRESCGIQAFQGEDVTYERFPGYDLAKVQDAMGCTEKVRRIAGTFPTLAQTLINSAKIRNYRDAPIGGCKCVDIPWLDQTPTPRERTVRRGDKIPLGYPRYNPQRGCLEFYEEHVVVVRKKPQGDEEKLGCAHLFAWWSNYRFTDDDVSSQVNYLKPIVDNGNSYIVWRRLTRTEMDVREYIAELSPGMVAPFFRDSIPKVAVTMDPLPRRAALCRSWIPSQHWGIG